MRPGSLRARPWLVTLVAISLAIPAAARDIAAGEDVQQAVVAAETGEVLVLLPGRHRGPVQLDRPITLTGREGAVLEAPGRGSVVTISAEGAAVRGLTLRGSGSDLVAMDSGVLLHQTATGAVAEGNRIEGNLFGVYVHGAAGAMVRGNVITGRRGGQMSLHGNGVSVWNAPGARVEGNDIRFGRDGIFALASRQNGFLGNRFRDLRFAVHYMYTNDSEISGNASIGNHVGYAIMYSQRLQVRGNLSDGDREHGMLFNYANGSEIIRQCGDRPSRRPRRGRGSRGPRTRGARRGGRGRQPDAGEMRLHLQLQQATASPATASRAAASACISPPGSEGNAITGNAFIGNRTQMKYVGTRELDWSPPRPRQFLVRQPGLRPRPRRHRRYRLPAERHRGPGAVERAAGQDPAEQPGGAGAALGAIAVSVDPARRRGGQPPAGRGTAATGCRAGMAPVKADLPVIELDGVAKDYGAISAVRDVSFSLVPGSRVALVGHNGAGKTTLMKLMLGLIRPSAGSLRVLGEESGRRRCARRADASAGCRKASPSTPP